MVMAMATRNRMMGVAPMETNPAIPVPAMAIPEATASNNPTIRVTTAMTTVTMMTTEMTRTRTKTSPN